MTLTNDVVERVARGLYESSGYEAERVAPDCSVPGYDDDDEDAREFCRTLARAALEAARYGEMRESLRRVLEWWPERSEDSNAAAVLYGGGFAKDIVKARALLSTIGEPNPDLGATQP